jgi:hypothetical protein
MKLNSAARHKTQQEAGPIGSAFLMRTTAAESYMLRQGAIADNIFVRLHWEDTNWHS